MPNEKLRNFIKIYMGKIVSKFIGVIVASMVFCGCDKTQDVEPRLRSAREWVVMFGAEADEEIVEIVSQDSDKPVNFSFSQTNLHERFKLVEKRNNGFDLDIKSMRNEWLYAELDVSNQSRLRVILRAEANNTGKIRECIITPGVAGTASAPYIRVRQYSH